MATGQQMYSIPVPDGIEPGMQFQANLGGVVTSVVCPEGVSAGAMIQVAGPAVAQAVAVPQNQYMNDADGGLARILGPQEGILVRQKLDIWELVLPLWEKRNKYKVAAKPKDKADVPYEEWEDKMFKKALKANEILTMKEKSECFQRVCCGPRREFRIKVKAGDDVKGSDDDKGKILEFERPFKCTIPCVCCLLAPQEMTVRDRNDKTLGYVRQVWKLPGSLCCKNFWHINDGNDETKYILEDDMCAGCNCCAPSMCFKVRQIDLYDKDHANKVGELLNVWPGCNMKAFFGDADNYVMNFPTEATPEEKAVLLGAVVLVDFMLFEKDESNDNNNLQ